MMTFQEAVDYIEETPKFTKKNSLDHTRAFLKRLGSPEEKMKILHVAGTNGKGSVCSFLASILHTAGIRTGLFTSPHLVEINERFVIDEEQASDEAFLRAFQRVMDCVNAMKEEGYPHPTYFELLFLIGMLIFEEANVEYLVLETGLGGRLDATNSVQHPVATILTSISLDHTEYLGDTVVAIAGEKAGIIKAGVPVIYDASCREAEEVILAKAKEMQAPAYGVSPAQYRILRETEKSIDFSVNYGYDEGIDLSISSAAEYQVKNAAEAVTAIHVLDKKRELFTDAVMKKGIAKMRWQGRMETVLPGVIIDGGHNEAGVEEFVKTAKRLEKEYPVTLLFAAVGDKDYPHMIETICRELSLSRVIVTEVGGYRSVDVKEPEKLFQSFGQKEIRAIPDVREAFEEALREKGDGILFCVGSLYLVGSIKKILRDKEDGK